MEITVAKYAGFCFGVERAVNTVYDIEVGGLRLYNGNTGYFFFKINGELKDRWVIDEIYGSTSNYFSIRTGGPQTFCTFEI